MGPLCRFGIRDSGRGIKSGRYFLNSDKRGAPAGGGYADKRTSVQGANGDFCCTAQDRNRRNSDHSLRRSRLLFLDSDRVRGVDTTITIASTTDSATRGSE